jgi:glycosyltransferase involved in cell wall biosynthesis
MNILYIFQDEYPWDVRVEKIVTSLSQHHQVGILCRNRGSLGATETIGNVRVYRVGRRGLLSVTGFPAFFSPWWINSGVSVIRNEEIQLIVVRDLPLCPLALVLKKLTGTPVVFDMAEDYPAMIEATWKYRGPKPVDYLIRNPYLLRKLERFVLRRVDAIWVVSDASRNRIAGLTHSPITVVCNTPRLNATYVQPPAARTEKQLSVVYTGWIEEHRGVDTVIEAVAIGREADLPIRFTVVGAGKMLDTLRARVRELGLQDRIEFLGWRPHDEIKDIIAASDIGVVPHRVTSHTNTTLPNKIFDYMSMGKPVIVSNARALEELVGQSRCGVVFQDNDPQSLIRCLQTLRSPALRKKLGDAGAQEVRERWNWSIDEAAMLNAVNKFQKPAT